MKLCCFGKSWKSLLFCIGIYIVASIGCRTLETLYFPKLENASINVSLFILMEYGSLIFFLIPELKMRIKDRKVNKNEIRNPERSNLKELIKFLLLFIGIFAFSYGFYIYSFIHVEHDFIINGEASKSLKILFLILIYKISDKNFHFYRHHFLSMAIIVLMGLSRFFMKAMRFDWELNLSGALILLGLALFSPFIAMLYIVILESLLKKNYYSPYLVLVIMGVTISALSSLMYFIFLNVDCGDTEFCKIASKNIYIPDMSIIAFSLLYSFFNAFLIFINVITIYYFSVFYLMLLFAIGRLIQNFIDFPEYNLNEKIIIISTDIFEILSLLIFVEIIKIKCCGFNRNIRKNIIFRAEDEIDHLGELDEGNDEDNENIIADDFIIFNDEEEIKDDDNSVYN